MNICGTCSASVGNGNPNADRCTNGFIQGSYPSGIPNCLKEDGPAPYWAAPPNQWEALTFGRVVPVKWPGCECSMAKASGKRCYPQCEPNS